MVSYRTEPDLLGFSIFLARGKVREGKEAAVQISNVGLLLLTLKEIALRRSFLAQISGFFFCGFRNL
jgi:hypothetical protein